MGVNIEQTKIGIMAFADDLILIAPNQGEMKILFDLTKTFFGERALIVNAKKCMSLRMLPVKDKKSMKIVDEVHRCWNDQPIPSMIYETLMKYLGVKFNPIGEIIIPMEEWKIWFENLRKAELKPLQRIKAIRTCIIP